MIRRLLTAVLALAALAALAACDDPGIVTSTRWSYVCVQANGGGTDCHKVRHDIAVRCHVGDHWPDCRGR